MCHLFLTLGRDCLYFPDTFTFSEFTGKADTCAIETMLTRDSLRSKCHVTGFTAPMHFLLHVHLFDCVYCFIIKTPRSILFCWSRWFFRVYGDPNLTLTTSDLLRRLNFLEVVRALLDEFHCLAISSGMSVICNNLIIECILFGRSQWPRVLRCRSTAARLLRSWVRIPLGAWMFVCCDCCVLSGRGLCDGLTTRPGESYRLWCVVVCDQETS